MKPQSTPISSENQHTPTFRWRGLFPQINNHRCPPPTRCPAPTNKARPHRHATTAPLAGIIALILATLAPANANPPGPETTMDAYRTIEPWIRAWAIPDNPVAYPTTDADDDDTLGLGALMPSKEPVTGAAVTLRLGGRVIGRGRAFEDDATALWRATRLAWQEADAALPIPRDALRDRRAVETAQRITITLELAGDLLPIVDPNFETLDWRATPGNAGVAIRRANTIESFFPSELALIGQSAGTALRTLAHTFDPAIESLEQLRNRELIPYRFSTRQLAQIEPTGGPVFLHRGGTVVLINEITVASLHQAAADMAGNLIRQRWRGTEPHGMHGELLATTGRYRQLIAPPHEQTTVALALARFARTPGVDETASQRALDHAVHLLAELATVTPDERDPLTTPTDAALTIIAATEAMHAGATFNDSTQAMLDQAHVVLITAAEDIERDPSLLSPVRRSIIACALARSIDTLRDDERDEEARQYHELARTITRHLYIEADAGSLIANMPWLLWASQAIAPHEQHNPDQTNTIIGLAMLEAMRSQLWASQLRDNYLATEDADLLGGFVFTRGRTPLPTWQSLRPVIALATMIGDERCTTKNEFPAELARLRWSLRFTLQLKVRNAETHAYQEPDRAINGVRRSLWDHTIGPDATALALIALCEALNAIER